MQYEIKISGSGTEKEIINALWNLLDALKKESKQSGTLLTGEMEDPTLLTIIGEMEEAE